MCNVLRQILRSNYGCPLVLGRSQEDLMRYREYDMGIMTKDC